MEVKQAVATAKTYLGQVFEDEEISQVRLEEVEFDEVGDAWLITLGIMRPSTSQSSRFLANAPLNRTYKIIRIPNGGGLPSIKIRELGVDA